MKTPDLNLVSDIIVAASGHRCFSAYDRTAVCRTGKIRQRLKAAGLDEEARQIAAQAVAYGRYYLDEEE